MEQDGIAIGALVRPSRLEGGLALAWLVSVALLAALCPRLDQAMRAFCRAGGCSLNFPPICEASSDVWTLLDVGSAAGIATSALTVMALSLAALLPRPRPSSAWCLGAAAFTGGVSAFVTAWTLFVCPSDDPGSIGQNLWIFSWFLVGAAWIGAAATVIGWTRLAVAQLRAPRGGLAAEAVRVAFLALPVALGLLVGLRTRALRDERRTLELLAAELPGRVDLVTPTVWGALLLLAVAIRARAPCVGLR